jgi:nucleotide-binding universal stress UspA family protein
LIEVKDGAGATGEDRTSEAPPAPGGEPMTLRVVLAPLFGSAADRAGLAAARQITRRFDGHLTALFVRSDPADLVPIIGEGISPAIIDELTQAAQTETDRRAALARQQFEALSRSDDGAGAVGTEWLEQGGSRAAVVARFGRVADLTVLAGGDADNGERRMVIEAALMDTGRPLLLIPAGWTGEVGHTVAIAWNGRAEAARAVAYALPLLQTAQKLHVLTAETARTSFDASADLATYLGRHGLACERHRVIVATQPVGEALLRAARGLDADLLVMGGYGRSRLAELVLGGVTRHLLAHLERPLLLAH